MHRIGTGLGAFIGFFFATASVATTVFAGEPIVGLDAGAAIPISDFKQLAEPGAAVAPFVGYRWGESIGIALVAQPQFAMVSSDEDVRKRDDDLTSIFSFTAGPRLSVSNESAEAFLSVQGGVYAPTSGPLSKTAEGFNIAGGLGIVVTEATTAGLYIRRDEPSIKVPQRGNVEFLVTGIDIQHRFRAAAEAPAPVAPPPVPEPTPVAKKKIVLRGVNFDTNKANIRADAQPILNEAAKTLSDNATIQIAVEGHTDSRNTEEYNQKLSERRAGSVRDYLAAKGVDKARMTAVGFGESRPVASNDSAEGMAQNRRVELRISAGE